MTKIIAYLINLDDSTERLATATAHLQDRGIAFTRIPAVDGRKASPADFPAYDDAASQRHMGRGVMGGELGCFYSHLACAQALLAAGAESVFAIALATVEFEAFPAKDQPLQENKPDF